MGRIAQGTKVLAEGGHDRIFRQAFSAPPDEQLRKSYACYLSTAAGPVMGVLYLSTARVAFCSDSPLAYEASAGDTTEWSHYKVRRRIATLSQPPRFHVLCRAACVTGFLYGFARDDGRTNAWAACRWRFLFTG